MLSNNKNDVDDNDGDDEICLFFVHCSRWTKQGGEIIVQIGPMVLPGLLSGTKNFLLVLHDLHWIVLFVTKRLKKHKSGQSCTKHVVNLLCLVRGRLCKTGNVFFFLIQKTTLFSKLKPGIAVYFDVSGLHTSAKESIGSLTYFFDQLRCAV